MSSLPPPNDVMTAEEFQEWVKAVYEENGSNFLKTGEALGCSPMMVWRIVNDASDSKKLRAKYGIKLSDRVRTCFESTVKTRELVDTLSKKKGMTKKKFLKYMLSLVENEL